MSDYISRQAAIEALDESIHACNKALGAFDISLKDEYAVKVERASLIAYKEQLEAIPAADVVPVVHAYWKSYSGRRVEISEDGYPLGECFCSVCGDWLVASDEYYVKGYFCPNCGAKMDGGDGREID